MPKLALNRRTFLQQSAAASSALALPYFVPSSAFGANEKIITGHVGVGGQGNSNLGGFGSTIGAVCDVDANRLAAAVKKTGAKPYGDYRELLERDDIDAVVVSTPDHWHAIVTIHACQSGKHVYCEKPLSLTIPEGRAMVEAARKHKRVVQTGSQQRSGKEFWTAASCVRSGRIGKLHTVLVGINGANDPGKLPPDSDPPEYLNYEMWLGPAPLRPYNEKRVHYNFRFWWDYSGGQMTNWGAHHIDIGHWGMGADETGPLEVYAEKVTFHPEHVHEVTEGCRVVMKYADGVTMIIGQGESDIPGGTTFIGEKGRIHVNRGKISSDPEEIVKTPLADGDVKLYLSGNHKGNFVDCIRSGEKPVADVAIGHRSASACHLANIACRTGERFKWDPAAEQVVDNDKAAALISRVHRKPWELP
ncbi:MAG: Gfo/Idh/MocA family oxidoreductase, partial [Planctomycetales bacterium]|nr:Gfo/Idh/MocA family oxidoreductase [Planctomycetales bacterium]